MRHTLFPACLAVMLAAATGGCDDLTPRTTTPAPTSPTGTPTEPAAPAPAAVVMPAGFSVASPRAGETVSSPLVVTGIAPGDWYFEAVFEAKLLGADGTVLAEAPAQAQGDWMTADPVPFTVHFVYSSPTTQAGTIVLIEDQSGENQPPPRTVRLPVILRPAP